jgi:hypothetical protein
MHTVCLSPGKVQSLADFLVTDFLEIIATHRTIAIDL